MQKNNMMRLASVLLIAVLLSTCAVSGTFAKYTTTQSAESKARVAKWDIDFNAGDSTRKDFVFDLFKTIEDTKNDNENAKSETDVKQPDSNASDKTSVIAPGTSGSFTIELKNDSEVNAKYTISYEVENTNGIPLEFSTDGNNWYGYSNIDSIKAGGDNCKLDMSGENQSKDITVYWRWLYERPNSENDTSVNNGDSLDTSLAAMTTLPTITVTATVTVTQVD